MPRRTISTNPGVDPIYPAIESHKLAWAAYSAAVMPIHQSLAKTLARKNGARLIAWKGDPVAACAAMFAAGREGDHVTSTKPSTKAGMRAQLEYLARPDHGAFNPLAATLLASPLLAV